MQSALNLLNLLNLHTPQRLMKVGRGVIAGGPWPHPLEGLLGGCSPPSEPARWEWAWPSESPRWLQGPRRAVTLAGRPASVAMAKRCSSDAQKKAHRPSSIAGRGATRNPTHQPGHPSPLPTRRDGGRPADRPGLVVHAMQVPLHHRAHCSSSTASLGSDATGFGCRRQS
jgi:hypothetical protein